MANFKGITAPNPALNASLSDGHELQSKIAQAGLSGNPRLYANGVVVGAGFAGITLYPESSVQDNSDLPSWALSNWDGTTTLNSIGLPPDVPVYLQVWVAERQNFFDVAEVLNLVASGWSLDAALK